MPVAVWLHYSSGTPVRDHYGWCMNSCVTRYEAKLNIKKQPLLLLQCGIRYGIICEII